MALKRAIPSPTKAQQARQDAARDLGCIACRMDGRFGIMTELHHLVECGRTLGQDQTVALCCWHHRGVCYDGYTQSQMTAAFGPSLAKGSRPFHARYGGNIELLAYQNALLEKHAAY